MFHINQNMFEWLVVIIFILIMMIAVFIFYFPRFRLFFWLKKERPKEYSRHFSEGPIVLVISHFGEYGPSVSTMKFVKKLEDNEVKIPKGMIRDYRRSQRIFNGIAVGWMVLVLMEILLFTFLTI